MGNREACRIIREEALRVFASKYLPLMPSLSVTLEEQLPDQRSDQIAYRLTVENTGKDSIRIRDIDPRIPDGVKVLEVRDSAMAESMSTRTQLIEELNQLLYNFQMATNEPFRDMAARNGAIVMQKMFSVSSLMKIYAKMIFSPRSTRAKIEAAPGHLSYKVRNLKDAEIAYANWLQFSAQFVGEAEIYKAKMDQLREMDQAIADGNSMGLTTIEPGAKLSSTYVLRFKRGLMTPRKYQLALDVTYDHAPEPDAAVNEAGEPKASPLQRTSVASNALISPFALAMNLMAVIGALLGVAIKLRPPQTAISSSQQFWSFVGTNTLWTAPIIALIFFNIYEYTSVGKGLIMSISWRSALLIGALCGISQDKIIVAINAFIGK